MNQQGLHCANRDVGAVFFKPVAIALFIDVATNHMDRGSLLQQLVDCCISDSTRAAYDHGDFIFQVLLLFKTDKSVYPTFSLCPKLLEYPNDRIMIGRSSHFANAVHGEHGISHVDRRNAQLGRRHWANS